MAGKKRNKYVNLAHFLREVENYTKIEYTPTGSTNGNDWKKGYNLKGMWTTESGFRHRVWKEGSLSSLMEPKWIHHAYFESEEDAFWFTMHMGGK